MSDIIRVSNTKINSIDKLSPARILLLTVLFLLLSVKIFAQLPDANSNSPVCAGSSIMLSGNPSGPYSYTWTGPNGFTSNLQNVTIPNATTTMAGTYILTVTYPLGIPLTAQTTVVVNAVPSTPTITAGGPTTFCAGGSVTLTSSASTGYLWSTGATSSSINVTLSGSYTVRVTDSNGCQSAPSAATVVTVNALPIATISASGPTTFCAGGSVTLTSSAGSGYLWSTTATIQSITVTMPGSYTVQVTNASGCQSAPSAPTSVTVNALPATPTISAGGPTTFCAGGSVMLTSSAGSTYKWSSGETTQSINVTSSGSYTVQATNAAGCLSAASAATVVIVNALPIATISASGLTTFCAGGSVTLTSSAGSGYLWSTTATTQSITVTMPGSYTVQVTNASNCQSAPSAPTSVTVNALPATPTITAGGPTTFCAGGSVMLTSSAGSTYKWSSGETTQSINVTSSGSYTVQATNAAGCLSAASAATVVTENALPAAPTISAGSTTSFCAGGSVTLTSSAGSGYKWSSGETTQSINITSSGSYTVQVTNAAGCLSAASAATIVTVNPLPIPTLTSSAPGNVSCAGTNITFTAGGGTNYNFRVGGVSVQNGPSATYSTGTLTNGRSVDVIVTSSGCLATSSSIVSIVNPLPFIIISSAATCSIDLATYSLAVTVTSGTTVTSTSGTPAYTGGNVWTITGVSKGTTITVKVADPGGCESSLDVTAPNCSCPVVLAPVSGGDKSYCQSGIIPTINATVLVGETVVWYNVSSGGTILRSGLSYTPTASGTYYALARNTTTNCVSGTRTPIIVTMNPLPTPTLTSSDADNIFCAGTSITFTAGGGTGFNFRVGGVIVQSGVLTTYTSTAITNMQVVDVIVTNASGCTATSAGITNSVFAVSPANAGIGGDKCGKDFVLNALVPTDGTGTWTKTNGPGTALFTPDTHQPNAKVTVDKFGTYNFSWTVVNSTCISSEIVKVVFHDLPSINAGRDTTICKESSIQLHAIGAGSFSWLPAALLTNPNIGNPIATPDAATTFTVNLTDQFGCKNSDNIVVAVREKLIAYAGPDQTLGYQFETSMNAGLLQTSETGVWSVISGTGDFPEINNAKTPVNHLSAGINKYLWTVTNGFCSPAHDTVSITVNDFVIPTLITPNMDGRNDYFVLMGLAALGKTELVIFDRRGAQVYKNLNYDNSWNGVDYNKNPLPDDTYFYVMKSANGKSVSGYIVIRR